ncbi:MAG: hypothetical protein QMB70_08130, partial [Aeromonadaceae bacterium]
FQALMPHHWHHGARLANETASHLTPSIRRYLPEWGHRCTESEPMSHSIIRYGDENLEKQAIA